jgi:hypothetical protein
MAKVASNVLECNIVVAMRVLSKTSKKTDRKANVNANKCVGIDKLAK